MKTGDQLLKWFSAACALFVGALLLSIVGVVLYRGGSAVSWGFLTEQIRLVGASGGIFYNIVGTVILIGTAALVAAPIALSLALLHMVYLRRPAARAQLNGALYLLNGVPSIAFGIAGLIVFVKFFHWGKSWLAGGILLGIMILPTVAVSVIERMRCIPGTQLEAAAGLGLNKEQVVRAIILPQSLGGLWTGIVLGLARAAGETAPIMFTATIFAGAGFPGGIKESPVLSLPYHIFILAQDSFDPSVATKLWGTVLVLVCIVFVANLAALPARLRAHEEARHG